MRAACVLISDFEVAVELARHPELAGRPVVVGGLPHERKRVRSRSPEAAAYGVVEGMSLRQARELCPEAVFLPLEEELYQRSFDRLLTILERFSPTVEVDAGWTHSQLSPSRVGEGEAGNASPKGRGRPSVTRAGEGWHNPTDCSALTPVNMPSGMFTLYLDAAGLERLFGPDRELGQRIAAAVEDETGLHPRVGLGCGKFVARAAALQAAPGATTVVKGGEERSFLAPLPVGLLRCSEEMQRRMDLLGLRTLGQLAGLPVGALGEQFGPEGMEAYRLARGMEKSPLIPHELPRILEKEVEIDQPTDRSDLLRSITSNLIDELTARMRSEYLACREVTLLLGFTGGPPIRLSTTLHEATDDAGELQRAVGRLLGRIPPSPTPPPQGGRGFSISSLRITLSGFGGREEEQLGLFRSRAGGLQRVRRAIERAEEQFGEGAIRPLVEVDGEKAPETPLRVIADEIGRPAALFLEGRRELVRELCNRWRVREEWWRHEVYRDYFRLITESGLLCVVFRDLTPQPPSLVGKGENSPPRCGEGQGERFAPWFLERIYG